MMTGLRVGRKEESLRQA